MGSTKGWKSSIIKEKRDSGTIAASNKLPEKRRLVFNKITFPNELELNFYRSAHERKLNILYQKEYVLFEGIGKNRSRTVDLPLIKDVGIHKLSITPDFEIHLPEYPLRDLPALDLIVDTKGWIKRKVKLKDNTIKNVYNRDTTGPIVRYNLLRRKFLKEKRYNVKVFMLAHEHVSDFWMRLDSYVKGHTNDIDTIFHVGLINPKATGKHKK